VTVLISRWSKVVKVHTTDYTLPGTLDLYSPFRSTAFVQTNWQFPLMLPQLKSTKFRS